MWLFVFAQVVELSLKLPRLFTQRLLMQVGVVYVMTKVYLIF